MKPSSLLLALAMLPAATLVPGAVAPAYAQSTFTDLPADAIAQMQGRWISRYEGIKTEIEITGTEVRYVTDPQVGPNKGHLKAGDLVARLAGYESSRQVPPFIKGEGPYTNYSLRSFCFSKFGNDDWHMTERPYCPGSLTRSPAYDPSSQELAFSYLLLAIAGDEFWRPMVNDYYNGPRKNVITPALRGGPETQRTGKASPPPAPAPAPKPIAKGPAAGSATANTAAAATGSGTSAIRAVSAQRFQRANTQSAADAEARARLNAEQAAAAAAQQKANAASQQAHDDAVRAAAAEQARQKAAYEAETARLEREHEEAMARWRAQVEACKKGDRKNCPSK